MRCWDEICLTRHPFITCSYFLFAFVLHWSYQLYCYTSIFIKEKVVIVLYSSIGFSEEPRLLFHCILKLAPVNEVSCHILSERWPSSAPSNAWHLLCNHWQSIYCWLAKRIVIMHYFETVKMHGACREGSSVNNIVSFEDECCHSTFYYYT